MRWEDLFDDLAGALEEDQRAERELDLADRIRAERAVLDLARRLRGQVGVMLTLEVLPERRLRGIVREVGGGWLALEPDAGERQGARVRYPQVGGAGVVIVQMSALTTVRGMTASVGSARPSLPVSLGLSVVARSLALRRVPVSLDLSSGRALHGTLDRVGTDHVDLAEHPLGELRRASAVRDVVAVPLASLALVTPHEG